ncbi:Origin recognition complex, subunit 6, partial [Dillenia turbinata]
MDLSDIARKLNLSDSNKLVRKAAELRRLSDVRFDSSIIGVGEVCKAIICLEIAASRLDVIFDRQNAIKLSGMSEKAYNRSFNAMQNGLGVKTKLDIRELGIQFGCVRLIPLVQRGLNLYKDRFLASLPPSRRTSADFTRPVFTAVAFYLCAKKIKLKVDKLKLIEVCGTSEAEFSSVSTTTKDLCHNVFGVEKEKKDPREVKRNRELLDVLPGKRRLEDGGYVSNDGVESSCYKKGKRAEKHAYEEWKTNVLASNNQDKAKVLGKRTKQARLDFRKEGPENQELEVMRDKHT